MAGINFFRVAVSPLLAAACLAGLGFQVEAQSTETSLDSLWSDSGAKHDSSADADLDLKPAPSAANNGGTNATVSGSGAAGGKTDDLTPSPAGSSGAAGGKTDDLTSSPAASSSAAGGKTDDLTPSPAASSSAAGGKIDDLTSTPAASSTAAGGKIDDLTSTPAASSSAAGGQDASLESTSASSTDASAAETSKKSKHKAPKKSAHKARPADQETAKESTTPEDNVGTADTVQKNSPAQSESSQAAASTSSSGSAAANQAGANEEPKQQTPAASITQQEKANTEPPAVGASKQTDAASAVESPTTTGRAPSASEERSRAAAASQTRSRGKRIPMAAPLCTIDSFARSALVQAGAWPGVGPFKMSEDGGGQLIDDSHNSIKLKANQQQKVTGVELQLNGGRSQDFISVEMATDFLLEALGTRPARISDFNSQLEHIKKNLFGHDNAEQDLSAGHYLIYLKPGKGTFNVRVNNGDASVNALREISTSGTLTQPFEEDNPIASNETRKRLLTMLGTHQDKPSGDELNATKSGGSPVKGGKRGPLGKATSVEAVSANADETLKDTFKELIERWQQIKKDAVKSRDTKDLSKVLAGKALAVQTNGVKWLATNHKYYEMEPEGVEISACSELAKGKKYSVTATVKELSKFYDEAKSALLRNSEDTYNVNYTVEKIGNHFLISDSAIVHFAGPETSGKGNSH